MLIQQRVPSKDDWPNLWDVSCAGSAISGDTSQTAAVREVLEELGLKINLQNERPHLTNHFDVGFNDVYILDMDVDLSTLKLQPEEVQNVKWASKEEIFSMIDNGTFIPYHKSWIDILFYRSKIRSNKVFGNYKSYKLSTLAISTQLGIKPAFIAVFLEAILLHAVQ
jgi:isopentenyldiphosphate isomerase